jgi:alpha-D-xyloside xylohydrolase
MITMKIKFGILFFACLFPLLSHGQVVKSFQQLSDRINVTLADGTLDIYPFSANAVRIKIYKEPEPRVPEFVFSANVPDAAFKVTDSPSRLKMRGGKITVELNKQTGHLSFTDNSGNTFLSEKPGSRKLISDSVMGEPCYFAEQSFELLNDEYIFGLGQFQDGHYNLRNITRRLTQVNSQISIPFIFSSKGYGLLWHQYGLTDFNPADNFVTLEKQEHAASGDNQFAEVTTTSGTQKVPQNQSLYNGKFEVPKDGVYSVFLDLGDMDNRQYLVIDGEPCIDISNYWLPPTISTLVELKAGEHQVQVVCKSANIPKVSWKLVDNLSTFRSPNAKLIDYVVFYGPSADTVISSYRNLSGNAPMFPKWAFGFWQCRERYTSGTHLVETVEEFRKRKLPMDVIVQDWQYWGNRGWGVPQFDETNYPNPTGFIKEIHDLNAHFNISIWSNPDKDSEIGKLYVAKDRFIPNTKWLDYFNPVTRKEYWNTLKDNMFDHGVDSWWMDAVEPENDALTGEETYAGLGDFYRLTYPLLVGQAVYEGQRQTTSDKRVCILTRSAFPGQQRYAIINWSGDIGGDWETFKRQIVAGLNYTITGLPYWTTDIGGFFRPGSQYTDEKFHELLTRWYQWSVFNPIFRMHAYQTETEPWKYGQTVENNMRKMLSLRYRLLPYIYSEAWQVTNSGSTMMRPLVMDFNGDDTALNQPYEYMFGNALLVAPVTESEVKEWNVYLPESTTWYDFWTGKSYTGDQSIKADAPLDKIPLFVKGGSIIPMGPLIQYSTEKNDPLEIRVYPGADGDFTLYEDENDNYNYEKGIYSTIVFRWNESANTLNIGKRQGDFPGMLKNRTFKVVFVSPNHGTGIEVTDEIEKVVKYNGMEEIVVLK